MDPTAFISSACTGVPSSLYPTTILLNRALKSSKFEDNANIAITSEAVTMSNPVSLRGALALPPSPVKTLLRDLSSTSVTLLIVTPCGENPLILPLWATLSVKATSKL